MHIYIPDNLSIEETLARTTHLAISAHQDDIEFMAYDGILKSYDSDREYFTAVVVGDGAGSPRAGKYAECTDEEMKAIRIEEQKAAARLGHYNAVIFLDRPSSEIKDAEDATITVELLDIISRTKPEVIYTHNPADKHDTHVATLMRVIKALRRSAHRPTEFYGCEVWRGLDWMCAEDKVAFKVDGNDELETGIMQVYDSQIAGGKRYDQAVIGRRMANATFSESHGVDEAERICFAMDLMPLIKDESLSVAEYVDGYIKRFADDVANRLNKYE